MENVYTSALSNFLFMRKFAIENNVAIITEKKGVFIYDGKKHVSMNDFKAKLVKKRFEQNERK